MSSLFHRSMSAGKVCFCGEARGNYPEIAAFRVKRGIDSIFINHDRFVSTKEGIAKAERR